MSRLTPMKNLMPERERSANPLLDMLLGGGQTDLDDIAEPSAEELAALDDEGLDDEIGDLDDIGALADLASLTNLDETALPANALAILKEMEEPELVSLEGLDDSDATESEPLDAADELPEEDVAPLDEFVDVDVELDDEELADDGYDLDVEEVESYRDLYGDDDAIIPSFREGGFMDDDDDDGDSEYFDEMR